MFAALRVRNYRLYASGQVISNTGTWMARVTQDWLVYHILTNDNSLALGFVTALQFLPALVFGMYGGMLGDRYSKRKVLTVTQSTMAAISLLSGLLLVFDAMELWTMCLIAFVFGIASALDMPVRQAFVIEMVGRETLQNAVSLNSATFNASRMLGPAAAGLLIEAFGTAPAFFINSVSYLGVIAGILAMTAAELHPAPLVARARGQLREGLSYVRDRPELLLPVMLMGFIGTFGFNFQITNALVAQGVFHRGAGSYGILSTVQAVGSLAGALLAARRRRRPRVRLLILAGATFSVLEAASGFMPYYTLFMVLLIPIGGAGIMLATSCNTTLQLNSAPHMQGRVMALYTTVFVGCAPIGSLLVGWLGGVLGPKWALFFGGAISLIAVLASALLYARSQKIQLRVPDYLWRPRSLARDQLVDEVLTADVRSR
jgi:MFS family permease